MILVIGSGLLGSDVIQVLGKDHDNVIGTYIARPKNGSVKLDITDREEVFRTVRELKPEQIVHTAAMTNVDGCEDRMDEALAINATGTKNVADAAREAGSKLIYVSTDFVFDGRKGMYREDDPVNPISFYGYSKLLGEYYTIMTPGYAIARTGVVFGNARQNYVSWVRDSLKNNVKIKVVTDQYNSPTLSIDCAEAIAVIIKNDATGIFHTAGSERVSRYEFAQKIAGHYGLDGSLIEPITSAALSQKARRPGDSSLDTAKIRSLHEMLTIDKALKKLDKSSSQ